MAVPASNYECATEICDQIRDLADAVDNLWDPRPIVAAILMGSVATIPGRPGDTLADRVRGAVGTADLILDYCAMHPTSYKRAEKQAIKTDPE